MSTQRGAPRTPLTLRRKLLLACLPLLVIPLLGYRYIQELDDYLRGDQEQRLLERAAVVAALLDERPHLFLMDEAADPSRHLYVRPLHTPILVDGYGDDWTDYDSRQQHYGAAQTLFRQDGEALSVAFDHWTGQYGDRVYALFRVKDDRVIYRRPGDSRLQACDHLLLTIRDPAGEVHRYSLSTLAPGWVNAYGLPADPRQATPVINDGRVKAEWQEWSGGYAIEVSVPAALIGGAMGFAVVDVDDPDSGRMTAAVGTSGVNDRGALPSVVVPSPQLQDLLHRVERENERVWVIDHDYRVVGLSGELHAAPPRRSGTDLDTTDALATVIYLIAQSQREEDPASQDATASTFENRATRDALAGSGSTGWRRTADSSVQVLTAAHPIQADGNVIGAVAVEQTSDQILLAQNRAAAILIHLSVAAFAVASTALLLFGARLSGRIRRLRDAADNAIAADGRVVGTLPPTRASDEVGDLSRSFAGVMQRLAQYNRYLEGMADRLAHELRTPVTVVRSSLENLDETALDSDARRYSERAREGVLRLEQILARMSEATRLEQAVRHEHRQRYAPAPVVESCVEGYRLAYPQRSLHLVFDSDARAAQIDGAPDLLAQALDKLIENAVDFSAPLSTIHVMGRMRGGRLEMCVSNPGPLLPEAMQDSLFNSMVSVRGHKNGAPHLGLGLYIVRLVAEYHGGTVNATNLSDGSGVRVCLNMPTA